MSIKLNDISTSAPVRIEEEQLKKEGKQYEKEIDQMQEKLFASGNKSVLIVLQGLDASGKDGATKKVFGRLNPQGVRVESFKKPTKEELGHDFLWRVHKKVPQKGMITIFNRSHYEDVLVTRVLGIVDSNEAEKRFQHINNFEQLLEDTGTKIIKFFLHVGKDKQLQKFKDRLKDPEKYWKYNSGDWDTRENWDQYIEYYQEVFQKCNQSEWNIIPADDNFYKEYLIAKKVCEEMKAMDLSYPDLADELAEDIKKYADS